MSTVDIFSGPHKPWYQHAGDIDLCQRLGLPLDWRAPHGEWATWGTVSLHDGAATVKVEVFCMPAVGFRFTVSTRDETPRVHEIETGTGSLSRYWPVVELFADGMLVVRRLDSEP